MRITFGVRDINDFWKRVYARYSGDFTRYNKLEKEQEQQRLAYAFHLELTRKYDKTITRIERSGTRVEKLILWVHRKTRKMLFGERPKAFSQIKYVKT